MKHPHIGKVYSLSYPFTDASQSKTRPTVIVIEEDRDYEVLYITSHEIPGSVKISHEDFLDGGLIHDSYIKVSKSIPFAKSLFTEENYIGLLSYQKMEEVLSLIIAKYQLVLAEMQEGYE